MNIALLQPKLSEKYAAQSMAYKSGVQVPETGLAVLSSFARSKSQGAEIRVLDPLMEEKSILEKAASSDLVGMSDWFSNHARCIEYAKRIKQSNSGAKIVLGGPNASALAEKILANHLSVDFVVRRDGEEAFAGIIAHLSGAGLESVPNVFFRDSQGKVRSTFFADTDLRTLPAFDYASFEDLDQRLSEYLKLQGSADPWLSPPLAIFSYRGCAKAALSGPCSYCTSCEIRGRALPAQKFWNQVSSLDRKYNARNFYISDDIFTVSPTYIRKLSDAKPPSISSKFRAYSYLPFLAALSDQELARMALNLKNIGVYNLFFGTESADRETMRLANKPSFEVENAARVMGILFSEAGIKSTLALLLGLPGESARSLESNFSVFEKLFRISGDAFERLYVSIAMPLAGSALFHVLLSDPQIRSEYKNETGKDLAVEDEPDYNVLMRLQLKHLTSVSAAEMNAWVEKFEQLARGFIPAHRIGGFKADGL